MMLKEIYPSILKFILYDDKLNRDVYEMWEAELLWKRKKYLVIM